jgi:glycosyltransferase involved in cell wall biosynthesis
MISIKPLFSIITSTHNRLPLLKLTWLSVANQNFQDWEWIVVNDGSTDDTEAFLNSISDERVRSISLSHKERSSARNNGIELAAGSYICFLDDDDLLLPDYLSIFYEETLKSKEDQLVYLCNYSKLFGEKLVGMKFPAVRDNNFVKFMCFRMAGLSSLCIPASCLEKLRFAEDFPHWQDTHLFLRLAARYPFKQIFKSTWLYRQHEGMGSKAYLKQDKFEIHLAAICHLFDHYGDEIDPFLPPGTKEFLLSEKLLQYSQYALEKGDLVLFRTRFRTSLNTKISLSFYKYYLLIFRVLSLHYFNNWLRKR